VLVLFIFWDGVFTMGAAGDGREWTSSVPYLLPSPFTLHPQYTLFIHIMFSLFLHKIKYGTIVQFQNNSSICFETVS
jgi:hypothetical protein